MDRKAENKNTAVQEVKTGSLARQAAEAESRISQTEEPEDEMRQPEEPKNGAPQAESPADSLKIAAIQMRCGASPEENRRKADRMVREAAARGAKVLLLPELFERPYFCQERNYDYYDFAKPTAENEAVRLFRETAAELSVVIPVSFFERDGNVLYNSVAMIDADGGILGVYRKTHIPDDHYYQEKFYFTPGNTGFQVFETAYGKIGVGICWDQWFPETARCLALAGAELILYPTAIGSEPILDLDSRAHWQRTMQGHAAANIVPVAAANRVGLETVTPSEGNGGQSSALCFYGSSFLTDEFGEITAQASRDREEIIYGEIRRERAAKERLAWGLFRDRRPECYRAIAGES